MSTDICTLLDNMRVKFQSDCMKDVHYDSTTGTVTFTDKSVPEQQNAQRHVDFDSQAASHGGGSYVDIEPLMPQKENRPDKKVHPMSGKEIDVGFCAATERLIKNNAKTIFECECPSEKVEAQSYTGNKMGSLSTTLPSGKARCDDYCFNPRKS